MLRRISSRIMLAMFSISMLTLTINIGPVKSKPETIVVPDDYSTIQGAINKASEGDTIFVSSGVYFEHVTVNKTGLTVVGENMDAAIIDGGDEGVVVEICADDVEIRGFTLQNGGSCCDGSGIAITGCSGIRVTGNRIISNMYGLLFKYTSSPDSHIYHNNIINNTYPAHQKYTPLPLNVMWDDGYPSGGNYWSNYSGSDIYSGPYQNESGHDGIGDTPYVIDAKNQDNFPLADPYIPHGELRLLYCELLEKYNKLLASYDALGIEYDTLNTSYNDLNLTYNELRSRQEATTNELNNVRNLTYVFVATTIILIALSVYFIKRKPRIKS